MINRKIETDLTKIGIGDSRIKVNKMESQDLKKKEHRIELNRQF